MINKHLTSHTEQPGELAEVVRRSLEKYFSNLEGAQPNPVYDMVIRAVEKPVLEVVMARTAGNQSEAAQILGINRNTLRKKLTEHRIGL